MNPLKVFRGALLATAEPRVLEVGTKRSDPDRPSHHRDWTPNAAAYVMVDLEAGVDVDVVTDLHGLAFPDSSFDVVIATSVFEHLKRPWIAAGEIARVLRPNGLVYVQTHQTFPIHGYPADFFRFTDSALELIFTDAGITVLAVGYQFPCRILPDARADRIERGWNYEAPAFLNVHLAGRR